jgi:hypothetical protein
MKGEHMPQYVWSALTSQQVGAYAEYFVKMELTMHGFQVYTSEVDDRGVDFVARHEDGPFIEVQVKSARKFNYVYMDKDKAALRDSLYLALAILVEERPPDLYLIPSLVWKSPNDLFVSRDYEGRPSKPEWGLNLSKKNMRLLEPYRFDAVAHSLRAPAKA